MLKIGLAAAAVVLVGAGVFFSGVLNPKETPMFQLQATLAETGEDVTDRVDWFVEWDGSWMGPDFATLTEARPGNFTATFQVLGGDEVKSDVTLGEDEGGTLVANLDATLVEVSLPADNRPQQVSFRFESSQSVGSQGVFVSEDGFARALVSRGLSMLQLEIEGQTLDVNADFGAGNVASLTLANGAVRASE